MTLDDIKARCEVEGKHWFWRDEHAGRYPRIWAMNNRTGEMSSLPAPSAVWQLHTGLPVPVGHQVYVPCDAAGCISPHCCVCTHKRTWGKHVARTGAARTIAKTLSAQRQGLLRRVLTDAQIAEIQLSDETGRAIGRRMGAGRSVVSKARRGGYASPSNPWAALIRKAA